TVEGDNSSISEETKSAEKPAPQPTQENPKPEEPKKTESAKEPVANSKADLQTTPSQPKESPVAKTDRAETATKTGNQQAKESSPPNEPQLRLDDPLDPEMLKGLSKKERRRLRKLHKDSQRKNN
ncbi:MAG: hypothetical protein KDA84_21990, partial [Planctomycetaceae bacterium]|nr:hypothetical protein [Planctomycetaceae bacterium]